MIFLVYFLIPLAIISVYYYHIARTLIKSAHDMPGEVSEHTKRQVSDGRMIFMSTVEQVFIPSMIPEVVLHDQMTNEEKKQLTDITCYMFAASAATQRKSLSTQPGMLQLTRVARLPATTVLL